MVATISIRNATHTTEQKRCVCVKECEAFTDKPDAYDEDDGGEGQGLR